MDTKAQGRHTPGPWREGPTEGIGQCGRLRVVDGNGVQIADCEAPKATQTTFVRPLREDTANARLIAAAPDLYEVLNLLWLWASEQRTHLDSDPVPDGLGAKVLNALAKAEGQPDPAKD